MAASLASPKALPSLCSKAMLTLPAAIWASRMAPETVSISSCSSPKATLASSKVRDLPQHRHGASDVMSGAASTMPRGLHAGSEEQRNALNRSGAAQRLHWHWNCQRPKSRSRLAVIGLIKTSSSTYDMEISSPAANGRIARTSTVPASTPGPRSAFGEQLWLTRLVMSSSSTRRRPSAVGVSKVLTSTMRSSRQSSSFVKPTG
mmetsp:Transcript_23450/g.79432  ORF Transcript_23450/g.79432 Transcript_23450/m.79432 type:complete len:204 (+) Transcript_23450:557-1168(+)